MMSELCCVWLSDVHVCPVYVEAAMWETLAVLAPESCGHNSQLMCFLTVYQNTSCAPLLLQHCNNRSVILDVNLPQEYSKTPKVLFMRHYCSMHCFLGISSKNVIHRDLLFIYSLWYSVVYKTAATSERAAALVSSLFSQFILFLTWEM